MLGPWLLGAWVPVCLCLFSVVCVCLSKRPGNRERLLRPWMRVNDVQEVYIVWLTILVIDGV